MHVVHVEMGRRLYGGSLQVLYLMQGLRDRGIESTLICPRDSGVEKGAHGLAGRIVPINQRGDLDPTLLASLLATVRRETPDLVHIHSRRGADFWGSLAARLTPVPFIVTRRVDNPERPAWLAAFKYGPYRRVVAISEGVRRVLRASGIPEDKMPCIPSAVDSARYDGPGDRDWFRREFALPPDGIAIGVIAQLIRRKGHRFLIEAAGDILRVFPSCTFILFGAGPVKDELQALCREKGVEDRFLFAGFRDDIPQILPCLDLVVHPATMEGLGVALLQSSAAGVPIVASRAGGIPEVVRDGVNGYLVEPGDPSGLARAILSVLGDAAAAKRMGEAGRRLARSEFSIDSMTERYIALYREVCAEGKVRGGKLETRGANRRFPDPGPPRNGSQRSGRKMDSATRDMRRTRIDSNLPHGHHEEPHGTLS